MKGMIISMLTNEQIFLLKKHNINPSNVLKNDNFLYKYTYVDMGGLLILDLIDIDEQYFEMMKIEKNIKQRKLYIEKALKMEDFSKILFLMDKPYRLEVYKQIFEEIPNEDKYKIFIDLYVNAEYGFSNISKRFLNEILKYKPKIDLSDLDDEIVIYRGEGLKSTKKENALSWTTDIKVAKFFANRFNSNGKIYKGKVKKENIIDFLRDRSESEILVQYKYIYDVRRIDNK